METSAPDVVNSSSADLAAEAEAGRTEVMMSLAERVSRLQPSGGDGGAPPEGDGGASRISRYEDTFADFSPDDIRVAAEAKRFFECHEGDRDFRAAVEAGGKFTDQQRRMLKDIGVTFEPEAMELLWLQPDLIERFPLLVIEHVNFEDVPSDVLAALAPYRELRIWLKWRHRMDRAVMINKFKLSARRTLSPEYTAWRLRRVAAVRNELGWFGWSLDHPCHAVEMAVGCSVQCYFCAFDAGKLQTIFDLSRPENRELVRAVATGMIRVLGWPAGHGMLYWSTEPHDNPHYVKLLGLWEESTGAMLCTATARAGVDWVRELIDYYSTGPVPWPRISVLSRGMLRRLHAAFSPMELRDTQMLMQQKDVKAHRTVEAPRTEEAPGEGEGEGIKVRARWRGAGHKVPGGREKMLQQLVGADDLRNVDFENRPEGFEPPQGSIACISGTLVNMVNRTVKLISPCYTTRQYPYGYRVFDEATFDDGPEGFEAALKRIIGRSMVVRPYPEMPMRWRDDLKVVPQPDGVTLLSPTTQRDFRRGELHVRTAELIGRGDLTYEQVFDALSDDPRIGPMVALSMLDALFRKGLLCEVAITRDYRARREAQDASLREPVVAAAAAA